MGCSGTMTRGEDLSFLGSYHIAGRGCNCGAASVFPLFTNQIMFMDCLLLSTAQTFHIHILLPLGDRGGAGRWNIEDASQKLQTSYSTCVGDTPVYAMVLKLPCTHLPCLSSHSVVHSPAHPPPANQGDKTQVSLLLAQQSPLYHHCHCFLLPALCGSPRRTTCWPQADGECLVPCSAPGHRGWDCQSQCCCCLYKVSEGQRWTSDGFQHVRAVLAQSTLKSLMGLGQCNVPGVGNTHCRAHSSCHGVLLPCPQYVPRPRETLSASK